MLKKAPYTTFKKETIIELQKTLEGIFNLRVRTIQREIKENTIRFSCITSITNSITKRSMQSKRYDLETFRNN